MCLKIKLKIKNEQCLKPLQSKLTLRNFDSNPVAILISVFHGLFDDHAENSWIGLLQSQSAEGQLIICPFRGMQTLLGSGWEATFVDV